MGLLSLRGSRCKSGFLGSAKGPSQCWLAEPGGPLRLRIDEAHVGTIQIVSAPNSLLLKMPISIGLQADCSRLALQTPWPEPTGAAARRA